MKGEYRIIRSEEEGDPVSEMSHNVKKGFSDHFDQPGIIEYLNINRRYKNSSGS